MKAFLQLFLCFYLASCATTQTYNSDLLRITVLHTNDVHGHAWPFGKPERGGLAAQAYMIKKIRKEVEDSGGILLTLSAGDINTGVAESDYFHGKPDLLAMEAAGYDAMVLGNHEFDRGTELIELQKNWVKFPFLSANVLYREKNKSLAKPFIIFSKPRVNIGVIGLTTDSLKVLTLTKHHEGLEVKNPIEALTNSLPQMKKDGAELLIALTHLGISATGKRGSIAYDDTELALKVTALDLIVGGHSHTLLPDGITIGNTLIVQAGEWGEYLGRVDLVWNTQMKKVVEAKASVLKVAPEKGEDPAVKKIVDTFLLEAKPQFDEVIGHAVTFIGTEKDKARNRENPLGNLICDALRQVMGTEIAVFNSGGIRASISAGPIRIRDIHQAFPFKNTVSSTSLTGKQLKALIQQGVENRNRTGSLLQVSGMSYSFKNNLITHLTVGGKPIQMQKSYTLTTNNFVMGGGDGLTMLAETGPIQETRQSVDEVLINFIKQKKNVLAKIEGRIKSIP